jgi:hypothetical protein
MLNDMKTLPAFILLLLVASCSGQRLKFAVTNRLDSDIHNVEVRLPDTTLFYASVKRQSKTDWVEVSRAYSYGYIKFRDAHDSEIVFMPIDYTGAKLYSKGHMQFILYYTDSATRTIGTGYSRSPLMSTRDPKDKD